MDLDLDPYAVLGVSSRASDEEIHSAYRSIARSLHPDAKPDDSAAAVRFAQASEAYELLHDPVRRRAFDLARAARQGPRPARSAPGPTGNTTVRGPSARPTHAPRQAEPPIGASPAPGRDELAFLFGFFKVIAVLVVFFILAVVIVSLNPAPYCGPGVSSPCRPNPSASSAGSIGP